MFIKALKWMMLTMTINIALLPWGTSLTVMAGYATIILTVIATIAGNKGKTQIELHKGTVAIMLFFVIMCLNMIIDADKISLNLDFFKIIACFFLTYTLINTKPQIHRTKDLADIFRINKLLSWVFIAYTFVPFSFRYTVANNWGATIFTMGMGNTNGTSIMVMFCIALRCLELRQDKKIFFKIVDAVAVLALLYTLILLQSRTAVASMILVIICTFLRRLNLKKWYITIILLIPVAYFILQIAMRNVSDIMILGKALNTGRGEFFLELAERVKAEPFKYILGSVPEHMLSNYHNTPIAIISNFGYVGFVLYFMFWRSHLTQMIEDSTGNMFQTTALVVLCAFVVHSSAEAAPMVGSLPYASAIVLITRLAKDRFGEDVAEENDPRLISANN